MEVFGIFRLAIGPTKLSTVQYNYIYVTIPGHLPMRNVLIHRPMLIVNKAVLFQ